MEKYEIKTNIEILKRKVDLGPLHVKSQQEKITKKKK